MVSAVASFFVCIIHSISYEMISVISSGREIGKVKFTQKVY